MSKDHIVGNCTTCGHRVIATTQQFVPGGMEVELLVHMRPNNDHAPVLAEWCGGLGCYVFRDGLGRLITIPVD